ncbi:hypothetical protein AAC387_Pa10g0999 [Persea americana]
MRMARFRFSVLPTMSVQQCLSSLGSKDLVLAHRFDRPSACNDRATISYGDGDWAALASPLFNLQRARIL